MVKETIAVGTRLDIPLYRDIKGRADRRKVSVSKYIRETLTHRSGQVQLPRDTAEDLLVLLDEKLLEDEAGAGLKTLRAAVWDALEG